MIFKQNIVSQIANKYKRKMSSAILSTSSKITFSSESYTAEMIDEVISAPQASFSSVLTLAGFLLGHMKNIPPPNIGRVQLDSKPAFSQPTDLEPTKNPLFEPWCDYLTSLFLKGQAVQKVRMHIVSDYVEDSFITQLSAKIFKISSISESEKETGSCGFQKQEELSEASTEENQLKSKKIGLINFATSQLRTDQLQPKIHLAGLLTGIFYANNDEWSVYNVLKGETPTEEQFESMDCVILSGSSLSINDNTPEIVNFIQSLKKAVAQNPRLKILGICFGHQALTKMFGGKVVKKALITGVEEVSFDQKLTQQMAWFEARSESVGTQYKVSEYHSDYVESVPSGFKVMAQSSTCAVQAMISDNRRFMSFQFHPEYSCEFIRAFEARTQHYNVDKMQSVFSEEEMGSSSHTESVWKIRTAIRNFFNWEVDSDPQSSL